MKIIYILENDIRKRLEVLKGYKMVRLSNGRGGTQITDVSMKTLKYIDTGCNGW